MLRPRVIPVLLFKNDGLVKSIKFKNHKYIGDPINAIKIFNDKEVDELIFLDIDASKNNTPPNFKLISQIASECFMPVCYGGGINSLKQIEKILKLGIEKIAINTQNLKDSNFIKKASNLFGSSTIVVSIDIKKNLFGNYSIYSHSLNKNYKNIFDFIKKTEDDGAGEILINSIYNDGIMKGYDLSLIKKISMNAKIPVIACGGASSIKDFRDVIQSDASAAAAGSFFVFHGPHKAVLMSYPSEEELNYICS
jgi:cyclase